MSTVIRRTGEVENKGESMSEFQSRMKSKVASDRAKSAAKTAARISKAQTPVQDPNERIDVVYKDPKLTGTQTVTGIKRSDWEAMKSGEGLTEVSSFKAGASASQINKAIESDVVRVATAGGGGTYFSRAELIKQGYKDELKTSQKVKILQDTYSKQFKSAPKSTFVLRRDYNAYVEPSSGQVMLYKKGREPFRSTPEGWAKIQPKDLRLKNGAIEASYVITQSGKNINTSSSNYGEANSRNGNQKRGKTGSGGLLVSSGPVGGADSLSNANLRASGNPFDSGVRTTKGSSWPGDSGIERKNLTEEVGQATSTVLLPPNDSAPEVESFLSLQGRDVENADVLLGRETLDKQLSSGNYIQAGKSIVHGGARTILPAAIILTKSIFTDKEIPLFNKKAGGEVSDTFYSKIGGLERRTKERRKDILVSTGKNPTAKDALIFSLKETGTTVFESPLGILPYSKAGQALAFVGKTASASKLFTPAAKSAAKAGGSALTGLWGASVAQEVAMADPKDRPEIIARESLSAAAFLKGAQKGAKQAADRITFRPEGKSILTGRSIEGGGSEFRLWQKMANPKGEEKQIIYSIVTKPSGKKGVSDYDVTKVYDNKPTFEPVAKGKTKEIKSASKDLNTKYTEFEGSEAGFLIKQKESGLKLKKDLTASKSVGATSQGRLTQTKSLTDAVTWGKEKASIFKVTAETKVAEPKTLDDIWGHASVTYPKVSETESSSVMGTFISKTTKTPKTSSGGTITEQLTTQKPSVPGEALVKINEDLTAKGVQTYTQPKKTSPIVKATQTKIVSASPVIGIKPQEEGSNSAMVLDVKERQTARVIGVSKKTQETTPLLKSEELEAIQSGSSLTQSLLGTKGEKKSPDDALSSLGVEGKNKKVISIAPHKPQLEGTRTITFFSKDRLEGKKVFRPQLSKVTSVREQKERKKRELREVSLETNSKPKTKKEKSVVEVKLSGTPKSRAGQAPVVKTGLKIKSGQTARKSGGLFSTGTSGRSTGGYDKPPKNPPIPGIDLKLPNRRKPAQQDIVQPRRRRKGKTWVEENPVGNLFDILWGNKK